MRDGPAVAPTGTSGSAICSANPADDHQQNCSNSPGAVSNALPSRRLHPTERRLLHDELDGAAPLPPVAICRLAATDHHRADMTSRKMVVAVSTPWMV